MAEVDALELLRAPQSARAEDVDLHELVADDVEADQEHAVLHQLGPHHLGQPQHLLVDHCLAELSSGVDVAAHVVARADPSKGGVLTTMAQRKAVHHEEPHVPVLRLRQILLCDHVAVAADGVDHLVQVGEVVGPDQEHALAARSLQRLEDDVASLLCGEFLDLAEIAGNQSAGPHLLREVLEVHLVGRFGQSVGVVEHDDAVPHGDAAEDDPRRLCPGAYPGVGGRIIAEHQYVEAVDFDPLLASLGTEQVA